jgi:hypothetical protein
LADAEAKRFAAEKAEQDHIEREAAAAAEAANLEAQRAQAAAQQAAQEAQQAAQRAEVEAQQAASAVAAPPPPPPPAFQVSVKLAGWPFQASEASQVALAANESVQVMEKTSDAWWKVRKGDGSEGYVPAAYLVDPPHGQAMTGDASDEEAEIDFS